jgi:uncharacterized protein YhfF
MTQDPDRAPAPSTAGTDRTPSSAGIVPDSAAAAALWRDYTSARPDLVHDAEEPSVEWFGDSPALADELLGLVLHGPKRATAGLVSDFVGEGLPLPRIGGHWIACDGGGTPRVVLRTVELRLGVAESVDDAFAWDEGEGDRTREDWLAQHRRYWRRVTAARGEEWSERTEVVFERFTVVWPPTAHEGPGSQVDDRPA